MPLLVLDEGVVARGVAAGRAPARARPQPRRARAHRAAAGAFDSVGRARARHPRQPGRGHPAPSSSSRSGTSDTAARDGLTGLYNRRAFDEHLAQAVAREDRQGGRFALLLLDIDHFKKLNDTFGHPAGDAALAHTGPRARAATCARGRGGALRRRGVRGHPARRPTRPGALQLAERVRAGASRGAHARLRGRAPRRHGQRRGRGLARGRPASADGLLAAADRALYAAKQEGRNRVVAAAASARVAGRA